MLTNTITQKQGLATCYFNGVKWYNDFLLGGWS